MSSEPEFTARGQRIWRRYDDGYIVRSMTPEDAAIVHDWYNTTMGDISRYDVNTALSCYSPNSPGFYIGEFNGEVVASAVRLPWGNKIMYGSFYYVAKPFRSLGFGTRLRDEVAREFVGERMLCVDACPGKVTTDNISKFNYSLGYECVRYGGVARDVYDDVLGASTNDSSPTILKATEVDFDKLISFDNDCFVSRDFPVRLEFLRRWISTPEGASYVAINSTGHVVGFGSRHPAINEGRHLIGPLYAISSSIAELLLAKLCAEIGGQNFYITVSSRNKAAVDMVQKFGLKEVFTLNRMHLNGSPQESCDNVYGFTSLDICGF